MNVRSSSIARRAQDCLVAGASRGFNVLPTVGPIYFSSAEGPEAVDVDGHRYLDYVMGWGSLLLGHNPSSMRAALARAVERGSMYQYETEQHVELAEIVQQHVAAAEKVRFTTSGLEAVAYAIRLARAHTGRDRIVKLEGHFHGLSDSVLLNTPGAPLGGMSEEREIDVVAASAGIPSDIANLTTVVPYNDVDAVRHAIARHTNEIAAVVLEPVALNMGCVMPDPGYLAALRETTREHGIVLIFDEVLTGFRLAPGGAQERFGVVPDLACLSKAFGCGMPIAALVGRSEIMDLLGPPGPVPMSGTHSARHFSVVGTLASLTELLRPGFYAELEAKGERMVQGLRAVAKDADVPAFVDGCGGRIGFYVGLTDRPHNLRDVANGWNGDYHTRVFRRLVREEHVYGFVPLGTVPDALNLSISHTDAHIDETLERVERVLRSTPYVPEAQTR